MKCRVEADAQQVTLYDSAGTKLIVIGAERFVTDLIDQLLVARDHAFPGCSDRVKDREQRLVAAVVGIMPHLSSDLTVHESWLPEITELQNALDAYGDDVGQDAG